AMPLASPSIQLPGGNHAGGGPHNGQTYTPGFGSRSSLSSAHHELFNRSGGIAAGSFGHGQANSAEPASPRSVPVTVSVSGISRLSRSQNAAAIRKLQKTAWCSTNATATPQVGQRQKPPTRSQRCWVKYGTCSTLANTVR